MKTTVLSLSLALLLGTSGFGQVPRTNGPQIESQVRFAAQMPPAGADAPPQLPEIGSGSAPEPIHPGPMGAPGNDAVARPLTLADLESIALANNPTLAQAFARVQAARGAWDQAGRYPNPTIGYQGAEIGNEGNAGQQGGFIAQEIVTRGKLGLAQAAASREIARLQQEYEAQRWRVLNDVRVEFYNVLIAQRVRELARELVTDAKRRADIAATGREARQLSAFEETQVQIDLHAVELMQQRAEHRLAASWQRLAGAAGAPTMPPAPLEGDVEAAIPQFTWEESRARVLTTSPELSAAWAAVARGRFLLARAQAEAHPNVELNAGVQHDNSTSDDVVGAQIAIPIPIFNRNQGGIRQAAAELRTAQADVARIELRLHNQLASVFERYMNARRQVEKYQQETFPRIRESQELLQEQAVKGQELSELEARYFAQTYRYITLAYFDALRDLWENSVAIEGLLLTDSLQAGTPTIPSIGIGPGGIPLGSTPLSR